MNAAQVGEKGSLERLRNTKMKHCREKNYFIFLEKNTHKIEFKVRRKN